MTVVQPNSIAGINSITVQSGNALAIHKSDGTLIQNIVGATGVSTFSSISVGSATTDNSAGKSINIGLGASISQHADNTLSFGTNGDERTRIHATGELQIGDSTKTSLSDRLLQIGKTDRSATYLELRTSTSGTGGIVWSDNTSGDAGYRGTIEYNQNDDNMFVKTAATERFRISSTGNVKIGSGTPGAKFHVQDANTTAYNKDATTAAASVYLVNTGNNGPLGIILQNANTDGSHTCQATVSSVAEGTNKDTSLTFGTRQHSDATIRERLRIDSSGRVGIGITNPTSKLQVAAGHINVDVGYSFQWGDSHERIEQSDGNIEFFTGNGEKMRLGGSNLGIGTVSPDALLHLGADSATAQLKMQRTNAASNGNDYGRIYWESYSGTLTGQLSVARQSAENDGYMWFATANSGTLAEKARIDADGRLLLRNGTNSSSLLNSGFHNALQVEGTSATSSSIAITRNSNDNNPPYLNFGKSRGTSIASNTALQDDDPIGQINFNGSDGSDNFNSFASVRAYVDGAPGNSDAPGRLTFWTNTDNSVSMNERLRIDQAGRVIIGSGDHAGGSQLVVKGGYINSYASLALANTSTSPSAGDTLAMFRFNSGSAGTSRAAEVVIKADQNWSAGSSYPGQMSFYTTAASATTVTERVRINSRGFMGPIARSGSWQGTFVYQQRNQSANYEHKIRGPLSGYLDTEMTNNFVAYIKVQTVGTGTGNAYCYYSYSQNSDGSSATLSHLGGNSGSSSNQPWMVLDGQAPCWKMAHSTNYDVVVWVQVTGGLVESTWSATGDYAAN